MACKTKVPCTLHHLFKSNHNLLITSLIRHSHTTYTSFFIPTPYHSFSVILQIFFQTFRFSFLYLLSFDSYPLSGLSQNKYGTTDFSDRESVYPFPSRAETVNSYPFAKVLQIIGVLTNSSRWYPKFSPSSS